MARAGWRPQTPCTDCGKPCSGVRCRRCYFASLPAPVARAYTHAERKRRKAIVDAHIETYGWVCPGYRRPAHEVEPGPRVLSADHVIPVGAGGDESGELAVLCVKCNSAKKNRPPAGASQRPAVRAVQPRSAPASIGGKPPSEETYDMPTNPPARRLAPAPEPEPLAPPPPAPEGAGPRGLRLWTDIVSEYDLSAHELVGLEEMVRCADMLDELHRIVQSEGLMVAVVPHGTKVNPAAVEARQLRIVFARIAAALRLPTGDVDEQDSVPGRPQKRGGVRGVYGIRGAV